MCRKQKVCVDVPVSQSIGPHLHASLSLSPFSPSPLSLSLSVSLSALSTPPGHFQSISCTVTFTGGRDALTARSRLQERVTVSITLTPLVFGGLWFHFGANGLFFVLSAATPTTEFVDYCSPPTSAEKKVSLSCVWLSDVVFLRGGGRFRVWFYAHILGATQGEKADALRTKRAIQPLI